MRRILFAVLLLGIVISGHTEPPPVSVSDARVRWLPGSLPMAGYFSLTSHASEPLRLVGATSPAFSEVMLHQSVEEVGVAHMVGVNAVTLAPGQSVAFSPGGYHLMLMDRKQTLQVGDEVPITLRFSDGQTLEAPFKVVGTKGE
jgi:copper(I)-binding protein